MIVYFIHYILTISSIENYQQVYVTHHRIIDVVMKLLVPVDESKHSAKAAEFSIKLAKGLGANITLIHVLEIYPYYAIPPYLMTEDHEGLKEIRGKVNDWFKKIDGSAKKQKVKVNHEVLLRSTTVVESIVQYAKRKKVDLIVIGTMGRSGFRKLVVGSVAQGVSQRAHCSALIVR